MAEEHLNINRCLVRLETKVDGINVRLDTMNGNVSDNADKVIIIDKGMTKHATLIKIGYAIFGVVGVGIAAFIGDAIINHYKNGTN